MVHEHIYNTKLPLFYFCFEHVHRHRSHPSIDCVIQSFKCCDQACSVRDYNECFVVTTTTNTPQPLQHQTLLNSSTSVSNDIVCTPTTSSRIYKRQDVLQPTVAANGGLKRKLNSKHVSASKRMNLQQGSLTTTTANIKERYKKANKQSKIKTLSAKNDSTNILSELDLLNKFQHDLSNNTTADSNARYKHNSNNSSNNDKQATKFTEYIIFDPKLWREQSLNHFMSFLRAVISTPGSVLERYKRFESSNFVIPNIKKYISGKESIIRTAITGFETYGVYQTATISCVIPYYSVIIPQKIYDILERENFDLNLVMVKRDPSILPTCMYVCQAQRNTNPNHNVIMISDQQSKGFNQDQDGDRNAIYLLKKVRNGYDYTKTLQYKIAKMELACAFKQKRTLIGSPRYLLSETSLLKIKRFPNDFMHLDFFRRTYKHGIKFMNEASAGYLSKEYDDFQQALVEHNRNEKPTYITVNDIILQTDRLVTIVTSGAKGSMDLIKMLLENISSANGKTLNDKKKDMLDLCNKYITSSKDLSRNGRKQFAALYAAHDLVSFYTNIYINKVCVASYAPFVCSGVFCFNTASMELFIEDLEALDVNDGYCDAFDLNAIYKEIDEMHGI
jgi:hypothetical protein